MNALRFVRRRCDLPVERKHAQVRPLKNEAPESGLSGALMMPRVKSGLFSASSSASSNSECSQQNRAYKDEHDADRQDIERQGKVHGQCLPLLKHKLNTKTRALPNAAAPGMQFAAAVMLSIHDVRQLLDRALEKFFFRLASQCKRTPHASFFMAILRRIPAANGMLIPVAGCCRDLALERKGSRPRKQKFARARL